MQNQSHDFNQLNYDTALYYHPTASMAAPVAGVDSLYDVETSPQQTSYPIPSWASNASLSPVTPVVHDDASPLMNRTPNNITTTSSLSSSSTRSSNSKSRTGGNRSKRPKRKQVKNACVNCQKACKKCDDGRPCQRCIKLGLVATCTNSPRKERKKGVKRGPYKKRQQRKMQLQQQQQQASSQQQVPMLTGDVNMMPLYDDYCPPALDLSRPRQGSQSTSEWDAPSDSDLFDFAPSMPMMPHQHQPLSTTTNMLVGSAATPPLMAQDELQQASPISCSPSSSDFIGPAAIDTCPGCYPGQLVAPCCTSSRPQPQQQQHLHHHHQQRQSRWWDECNNADSVFVAPASPLAPGPASYYPQQQKQVQMAQQQFFMPANYADVDLDYQWSVQQQQQPNAIMPQHQQHQHQQQGYWQSFLSTM